MTIIHKPESTQRALTGENNTMLTKTDIKIVEAVINKNNSKGNNGHKKYIQDNLHLGEQPNHLTLHSNYTHH